MRRAMVWRPLAETDLRLAHQMGLSDVGTTVPGVIMAADRSRGLRCDTRICWRRGSASKPPA